MSNPFDIFAVAATQPNRVAVIDAERSYSFAAVAQLTRAAVDILASVAGSGQSVIRRHSASSARPRLAFVATTEVETLCLIYAALATDCTIVPLHPRSAAAEHQATIAATVATSLSPESLAQLRQAASAELGVVADQPLTLPDVNARSTLAILQTSGSSGTPKYVCLSRRAVAAAATASAAHLGSSPNDRWLLCMPPAHIGGLSIIIRSLLARTPVVLAKPGTFDPHAIAADIVEQHITLMSLVPTMLTRLLDAMPDLRPPPSLRAVLLGGAPATAELLRRARHAGWPVLCTYGLSETCGQVATEVPGALAPPGSCGRPLPGVRLRIVDGTIVVGGPTLMDGYLTTDIDDAEGRRPPPHPPAIRNGWLHTDDLGRLDADGNLYVLGRRDDCIVTGGENVDPRRVEAILRQLPGVADAYVLGLDDPTWGQIVAAVLIGPVGLTVDLIALQALWRQQLPTHQQPRRTLVVDHLPLTPTGKPDKAALRRAFSTALVAP